MTTTATAAARTAAKPGWIHGFARRLLTAQLSTLRRGEILLQDAWGSTRLGETADLRATVSVRDPRFFREAVAGGTLGVAESYLAGDWDCDDLASLFRIFVRNMHAADQMDSGLARLLRWGHRWFHWRHANSQTGSRRNIAAHYDLGNDFFKLWLDDTLAYSCGIFATPEATLEEASLEKFDRVCRRLDLGPDDRILEIGTGWGGFAIHAATNYGCHVTSTTISRQQFEVAQERVRKAGLSDRVELLLADYRDLTGQFDKLVSIEMIEAVGHRYFDAYFRKCGELLRPEGSFVLQGIVMPERGYAAYLKSVDFIQRYVFPGGCLPSVASMLESAGRTTDLRLVHIEDFAPHYARTLRCWRRAFYDRLDDVRRLGYSEPFIRLWDYYLCYCEAVFEERYGGVVHLQFDKPLCRRDPLRITEWAAKDRPAARTAPSRTVPAFPEPAAKEGR